MKILINYADKQYEPARKWNTLTGKYIAKFDKVYEFSPHDIDPSFAILYHDILSQKRGNGLWLWKPYFVNKVLENCNNGDIIFYCDSGSFFTRSIKKIVTIISKRQPLFVCDIPLLESCFTKPLCFEKLELTEEKYKTSNQIIATYFCFLVTPTTRKFMAEWLSFCCDLELLSPAGLGKFDTAKKISENHSLPIARIKEFSHYSEKSMKLLPTEISVNAESTPKLINQHSMPTKYLYTQMISINL